MGMEARRERGDKRNGKEQDRKTEEIHGSGGFLNTLQWSLEICKGKTYKRKANY